MFFYGEEEESISLSFDEGVYSEKMQLSLQAFQKLKEACQKILRYFYVSHYSMEEIAESMEMASANVAKTQKNRCFNYWKKIIEDMTLQENKL
jgi:DNA-directed RNA polymerase specialized sigma24 family protein